MDIPLILAVESPLAIRRSSCFVVGAAAWTFVSRQPDRSFHPALPPISISPVPPHVGHMPLPLQREQMISAWNLPKDLSGRTLPFPWQWLHFPSPAKSQSRQTRVSMFRIHLFCEDSGPVALSQSRRGAALRHRVTDASHQAIFLFRRKNDHTDFRASAQARTE